MTMIYQYTAIDRLGETVTGEREATDEKTLAKTLRGDGFILATARPKTGFFSLSLSLRGIGLVEKMNFARNLAVMVGAGLSMTRALDASEEEAIHPKLKKIIADLRRSITEGITFSQALSKHREVFGDFFIHMVEAGELSGKLEQSLKLLARQMKRDHELRSRVRGALIYPAVILTVLAGVGILMLIYVVPTLSQTFKDLEVELPLTTKIILGFSQSLTRYGLILAGAAIILGYLLWRAFKSESGQRLFDAFILRVPVFGPLIQKFNSARFARTLASLIASGLSITKSLEITSRVVGNVRFQASLKEAIVQIEKGEAISAILRRSDHLYPPMVTQMIAVGEETGTLARMLLRVALFYEEEVGNTTKNISSIIEPILMVIIGAVVGLFALSMIQPLYSSLGNAF